MFYSDKGKKMKKRSLIKLENFLMISGKTTGAMILAFLGCWVVIPVRSIRDARGVSKELNRKFVDCFSSVYDENVLRFSQIPSRAYEDAKRKAKIRLQEYDAKTK